MTVTAKSALAGRAHQLLDYLEALHRLRHPIDFDAIPTDVLLAPSFPRHSAVLLRPGDDAETLLRVERVERPALLTLPVGLNDHVEWKSVERRPELQPSATPEIVETFEAWLEDEWRPWREGIQPTLDARDLFLRLYDQRIAAEQNYATQEVVWVHGIAVGRTADGQRVRLPLFVRPVRYDLDDRTGSIRITITGPPRLEIDPFERLVDTFDLMKQIEAELVAPDAATGADDTNPSASADRQDEVEIMGRIGNVIADSVVVRDADAIPAAAGHDWQIADIDALYHRRRPVRYEAFFRSLSDAIDDGYLPDTWSAILADEPTTAPVSDRYSSGTSSSEWAALDQRVLSPLPLNDRQRDVLTRIARSAGVTVQGPPGTGKSYTIAALTSHFLAHGLRVLICAEKPHPLRVIRDKMPPELQALCVAVLGDDRASKQQLEDSISTITGRVNGLQPDREQRYVDEIDGQLDTLRRRLAELRNTELAIRSAEQRRLTLDGTDYSPADAARHLSNHPHDDWLADAISPDTPVPLGDLELAELIDLTGRLSVEDRVNHGKTLAASKYLVTGADLQATWDQLDRAGRTLAGITDEVELPAITAIGATALQGAINTLRQHQALVQWATSDPWTRIHQAITSSDQQHERIASLVALLDQRAAQVADRALQLAAHKIDYPSVVDGADLGPVITKLRERFAAGRGLPRLGGGDLRGFVANTLVDGRHPATVADLDLIELDHERDQSRQALINTWNQEVTHYGLDALDPDRPEDTYQTYYQQALATLLTTPARARVTAHDTAHLFTHPPAVDTCEDLDRAITQLETANAEFERQQTAADLHTLGSYLADHAAAGHPSLRALHNAYTKRDPAGWDLAADNARRLHALAPLLDRHRDLTDSLNAASPTLALAHRTDTPTHDSQAIRSAWRWRQLHYWTNEIVSLGDLSDISARITDGEREEQRLLTEVVTRRAWLRMAQRTTGAQRSSLEKWAQAMRRVGGGTGKHAPRHRRVAQEAMLSAQDAVPVWIMSIANAIDSFRPCEDTAFDIVIIDEASQAPLDAIAALGLGQRVLVVGDDKQISPTTFIDQTEAARLQRQHLTDVPDAAGYDVLTSLYDTATRRFPGVIQLREHFRCLPEIIAFSNDLAYEGRVEPLREHHPDPDWQPTRAIRVTDGYRDGDTNPAEADATVRVVQDLLEDPAFGGDGGYPNGATIGIITMVGNAHAKDIQTRLINSIPLHEIESRRIRVGSPYEFQGDERDVIIIAMLDATGPNGRVTGSSAARRTQEQRYNVAASRARDQLIVVHSYDPAQLDETDLRQKLVAFAQNPKRQSRASLDLRESCESRFERDVLERLLPLGLRVDAQYPVAGYRIDFTLTDLHGRRVAVECDGDSYHGIEQLEADTRRQRILERLGWHFIRIRASEYYLDVTKQIEQATRAMAGFGLEVPDAGTGPEQ